jgi:hypothetical protein
MKVVVLAVVLFLVPLSLTLSPLLARDLENLEADIKSVEKTTGRHPFHSFLHVGAQKYLYAVDPKGDLPYRPSALEQVVVVQPPNGPSIEVIILGDSATPAVKVFTESQMQFEPTFDSFPQDDQVTKDKMIGMAKDWIQSWRFGSPGTFLKKLFIAKSMKLNGVALGGFYGTSSWNGQALFLSESSIDYTEWSATLYHENTHLTYYMTVGGEDPNHSFNKRWLALLPAGFQWEGMCDTCTRTYDNSLWSRGFLTGYNQASLSEDIAQFATAMFMGARQVYDCAAANDACKAKMALIVELFKMVDPNFNENYFNGRKTDHVYYFASNEFTSRKPTGGVGVNRLANRNTAMA